MPGPHPEGVKALPKWLQERLPALMALYRQQAEMFQKNTHRVGHRIVSLSQPWVRPIVRGMQKAEVAFGAKAEPRDADGYLWVENLRVENLRWESFNGSAALQESAERYRKA